MDFANERYVRLYVRDTITWLRLEWDGQNCLSQLLRKADRAGVIDIGEMQPWEAAVVLCRAPEDAARRGVGKMLELGCVVHDGDRLVFPRYIEANEAVMSDKQRAKESRAKRASLSRNVTTTLLNVTESHAESRAVTPSHAPSHGVTPRHSVPCRAVLNRTEPSAEPARAHEEQIADHWAAGAFEESIRLGFQKRFESAVQSVPDQLQVAKMATKVKRWAEQTARLRRVPEDQLVVQLLDAFFASDSAREDGFPPAFLGANPLQYFEPRKKAGPDVAVVRSKLSTLDEALNSARRKLAKLDPEDPDYKSKLYDAEREEREAEEARDRAKRKLAAAVGGE